MALDPMAADVQYDLAVTLINLGRTAEAIPLLRRTIELEPEFPDAYLHLAATLQQQAGGLPTDEAIDLCRRAIAADAENPDAHQLLGAFLVGRRELDQAEHHLLTATRLAENADDPNASSGGSAVRFGVCHARCGHTAPAPATT